MGLLLRVGAFLCLFLHIPGALSIAPFGLLPTRDGGKSTIAWACASLGLRPSAQPALEGGEVAVVAAGSQTAGAVEPGTICPSNSVVSQGWGSVHCRGYGAPVAAIGCEAWREALAS